MRHIHQREFRFTYRNCKDPTIVFVAALHHSIGGLEKLDQDSKDWNAIVRLHHRWSILATRARTQQNVPQQKRNNGDPLQDHGGEKISNAKSEMNEATTPVMTSNSRLICIRE